MVYPNYSSSSIFPCGLLLFHLLGDEFKWGKSSFESLDIDGFCGQPCGKSLHNYGNSPCSMDKSTINIYKWPCSIAMLNYQRVSSIVVWKHPAAGSDRFFGVWIKICTPKMGGCHGSEVSTCHLEIDIFLTSCLFVRENIRRKCFELSPWKQCLRCDDCPPCHGYVSRNCWIRWPKNDVGQKQITLAVFKIPLSFHYTRWFIGISILDHYHHDNR